MSHVFLSIGLTLLGPGLAAADDESLVEYAYAGPMAMRGRFDGRCDAYGLDTTQAPASLSVASEKGGNLTLRSTWINTTYVDGEPVREVVSQSRRQVTAPAGGVRIAWADDGAFIVYPYGWQNGHASGFEIRLGATRIEATPIQQVLPSSTPHWTTPPLGSLIHGQTPDFPGFSRFVAADGGLDVSGNVSLLLRAAAIELGDGQVHVLGPGQREVGRTVFGPVEVRTMEVVDAFLDLRGVQFALPADGGRAVCRGLDGTLQGTLTVGQARGQAVIGDEERTIDNQTLTLVGAFRLEEDGPAKPRYALSIGWVEAYAHGQVDVLGIDFQPALAAPLTPLGLPALGVLGVLGIAFIVLRWGSFVGFLYARFGADRVLDHPARLRLYEAVRERPGADLSELSRLLSTPITTLVYHVRVLQRTGKLGTIRHGRSVRVLPREAMPARPGLLPTSLLPYDTQLSFVRDLVAPAPVPLPRVVATLAERFGLSRRGALHVVHRAIRRGLVVQEPSAEGRRGRGSVIRCA